MSRRFAYLDRGIGESRGVVTLDGLPERLLIFRDGDLPALAPGARSVARVVRIDRAFPAAFLALPGGVEAMLPIRPEMERLVEGQAVEIDIKTEPRRGKLATARFIAAGHGAPQLLEAGPSLEDDLRFLVRDGDEIVTGPEAREMADLAEEEALAAVHALPGGGSVAIEPTRALVAIDVDVGARPGGDSKRVTRQANLAALAASARLMRLKGLGGLVVIDLAGRGHDGRAISEAARLAFQPDNPGVAMGAISRFGTIELTIPRRHAPVLERLQDEQGRLTPQTGALRLVRALEREGASSPGARLKGLASPSVVSAFAAFDARLADRLGRRFAIETREGWSSDRQEVVAQ